jgi:Xaa-Pro aminopeptidase
MDHHARRRDALTRHLGAEGLDCLVVSSSVNVTYLSGFTGDSSVLVLTAARAILVSDPRYTGQIADESPDLETHIRAPTRKLLEAVADVLKGLGCTCAGFESSAVTVAEFEFLSGLTPEVTWKPGTDRVEGLRMVKDEVELAEVREAVDIAERAFAVLRALLRPDDREKDLADGLESALRKAGGLGACFLPIVAVGERAALPHCPPTQKRVAEAGLLLVDWGATGPRHYKSDLTRVLDTRKNSSFPPDPRLEEVHAVVLRAQQAALRAIRPGAVARDVDAAARAVIAGAGFGDYFSHGLGHGIGLQVHEAPAIRPNSDVVLAPGMVFTVEPGIYLPGWGGVRIEDDVLVTPDGCEVLTKVPRDLETLRAFR